MGVDRRGAAKGSLGMVSTENAAFAARDLLSDSRIESDGIRRSLNARRTAAAGVVDDL